MQGVELLCEGGRVGDMINKRVVGGVRETEVTFQKLRENSVQFIRGGLSEIGEPNGDVLGDYRKNVSVEDG